MFFTSDLTVNKSTQVTFNKNKFVCENHAFMADVIKLYVTDNMPTFWDWFIIPHISHNSLKNGGYIQKGPHCTNTTEQRPS
jgi:hypothetical protein